MGRAGGGTKSSEVAFCRDGPCKDRQDPECEQRQREGCMLCMFALETLFLMVYIHFQGEALRLVPGVGVEKSNSA